MEKFLNINDVVGLIDMQKSWVYQKIAQDEFPKPIKIGSKSKWPASAIQNWMHQRIEAAKAA